MERVDEGGGHQGALLGRTDESDPYATDPNNGHTWVQEGPHLMIVVLDPAVLDAVSTDPYNGAPYVM